MVRLETKKIRSTFRTYILTFPFAALQLHPARLYLELLLEHRKTSTEHKKLAAEFKKLKAGAREHLNEQIQKVKDLEGKPL